MLRLVPIESGTQQLALHAPMKLLGHLIPTSLSRLMILMHQHAAHAGALLLKSDSKIVLPLALILTLCLSITVGVGQIHIHAHPQFNKQCVHSMQLLQAGALHLILR